MQNYMHGLQGSNYDWAELPGGHIVWQKHMRIYTLLMAVALLKSAYFLSLSTNSKRWYEAKLSNAGLSVDPVCVCVC